MVFMLGESGEELCLRALPGRRDAKPGWIIDLLLLEPKILFREPCTYIPAKFSRQQ